MLKKISSNEAQKLNIGKSGSAPMGVVDEISRSMPGVWKEIEKMYIEVRDMNKALYSYGFLTLADWAMVFMKFFSPANVKLTHIEEYMVKLIINAVVCTWRYKQSIYNLDADFAKMLRESMPKKIPGCVFEKLPELSLYINMPFVSEDNRLVDGCWVGQLKLSGNKLSIAIITKLVDGNLNANHLGLLMFSTDEFIDLTRYPVYLQLMLSAIFYMCTEEPEIENISGSRRLPETTIDTTQTRHGLRLFPPDKATHWFVGKASGDKIRRYRDYETGWRSGSRKGRRPHLRRGHWSHFWNGPRDGKRERIPKWIPPLFTREVIHEKPQAADNYLDALLIA